MVQFQQLLKVIQPESGKARIFTGPSFTLITTILFFLSFLETKRQRPIIIIFFKRQKQNGDDGVILFLFRNTYLDSQCKPQTKTHSKQIKELNIKSHVIGK